MSAAPVLPQSLVSQRPHSLEDWRARLGRERIPPVISIAGSRGKTSVIRAIESILRTGGYRIASWTDSGVEIEGQLQRGELGPWSRAMTRLAAGGLDVALRELDWATVQALGASGEPSPIVAIANLCANSEACLVTPETIIARRALERIRSGVAPVGRLVLNADDFAVATDESATPGQRYLFGISPETPMLRRHLQQGGDATWVAGSSIVLQEDGTTRALVDLRWLRWTLGGAIPFAVQTALTAAAVARTCGVPDSLIAAGLVAHDPRPEFMPGSFNLFSLGASTIVVDRPVSSWFLRATLRATSSLGPGRQIRVAGPMGDVQADDLSEVGRLLGRGGGVLILHGPWQEERLNAIRQGAAVNSVPPIVVQASDERSAILQGIGLLRSDDILLVLAEDPAAVVRLVGRSVRRAATMRESLGAA